MTETKLKALEDAELEELKRDIDLVAFLRRDGWAPTSGQGPGGPTYWDLRRNGERIIVSVDDDGHWIYAVPNEAKGDHLSRDSIIGYMLRWHRAKTTGHARAMLRKMTGRTDPRRRVALFAPRTGQSAVTTPGFAPKSVPSQLGPNPEAHPHWLTTNAKWQMLQRLNEFSYTRQRGLRDDIVRAHDSLIRQACEKDLPDIIAGPFINPTFGYVVPPSTLTGGRSLVVGWDRRFYQRGERKVNFHGDRSGLWLSNPLNTPEGFKHVVIAESPITALSFQQLFELPRALLVAFGGRMKGGSNGVQVDFIRRICLRFSTARVMLAVDNDSAGSEYSADIRAVAARAEVVSPARVANVKDWNDVLMLGDLV